MHHYFLCYESFLVQITLSWPSFVTRLADRRYFFESVHDGIKTDFTTDKAASSYIKIFNVLLPTNSSKQ